MVVKGAVLISPLGDISSYRQAIYLVDNETYEECISSTALVKSKLKAIIERQQSNKSQPQTQTQEERYLTHVLFVGLTSLIDVSSSKLTEESGEQTPKDPCIRIAQEKLQPYLGKKYYSYDKIHSDAEEALSQYIKIQLQKETENSVYKVDTIVVPALGKPGQRYAFRFPPKTIAAILLQRLYQKCAATTSEENAPHRHTTIMLDLTHGINFLPSLCLTTARLLAQIMLVRGQDETPIKIEAYNTDPFKQEIPLQINLTHEEIIENLTLHTLTQKNKISASNLQNLIGLEDSKKLREILSNAQYLLDTLAHPYPLALAYAALDFNQNTSITCIDELVEQLIKRVELKNSEANIEARTEVSIEPQAFFKIFLAKDIAEQVAKIVQWNDGYSLEEIERLAEIYKYVARPYSILIKHEMSKINEKLKLEPLFKGTYADLNEKQVKRQDTDQSSDKSRSFDKRIMVAHAGFQEEFIWINQQKLSYYLDNESLDPRNQQHQDKLKERIQETTREMGKKSTSLA